MLLALLTTPLVQPSRLTSSSDYLNVRITMKSPQNRHASNYLIAALLSLPLAAPVFAQQAVAPAIASQARADYVLAAGDSIKVQVFQNPNLTVEARVSENGAINYPLLGSVNLGGLSITAAELKIADALQKGGFLVKPQVSIDVTQIRGNRVSVLGQVAKPGRYPLENSSTRLSDVLADAGGAATTGDDYVIVTGVRDGKSFTRKINVPDIFNKGKVEDDIILTGGDRIYVNRAAVFYIYGEAQHAGSYRIEPHMTVMQALAQGGGATARGSDKRLIIRRTTANGVVEIEPKLTDLVQPDDVIYVKESIF